MNIFLIILSIMFVIAGFTITVEQRKFKYLSLSLIGFAFGVLSSWIVNWTAISSTIHHNNISSIPVAGGQLEFFEPVDVEETSITYPWWIAQGNEKTFKVVQ